MKDYIMAKVFSVMLESRFRKKMLQPDKIVNALKIKQGDKIADIGAGTGMFSELFAKKTQAEGIVYAVEPNPYLIKTISKKRKSNNLKPILASDNDFNLPEQVDKMFMCDVLHHVVNKSNFLNNVRKYLKTDGVVAIIDFNEKWPPFHQSMKFSMAEYENWIKQAGMKQVEEYDFLKDSMASFFHICKLQSV